MLKLSGCLLIGSSSGLGKEIDVGLSALKQIRKIGFRRFGAWVADEDDIKVELQNFPANKEVLYAFGIGEELCYIGKTTQGIVKRLRGYRKPGGTQFTNIRLNGLIKAAIAEGKVVEVYVWAGDDLLSYGGFKINLSAGLEDSLIETLSPPWNMR